MSAGTSSGPLKTDFKLVGLFTREIGGGTERGGDPKVSDKCVHVFGSQNQTIKTVEGLDVRHAGGKLSGCSPGADGGAGGEPGGDGG